MKHNALVHQKVDLVSLGLERNSKQHGSWTVRRRVIALTLTFCAVCVIFIMYKGIDTETARTIVQSAFTLAGAVVMSYIGGATWDDQNKLSALLAQISGTNPPAVAPPAAPPASGGKSSSSMPSADPPPGN